MAEPARAQTTHQPSRPWHLAQLVGRGDEAALEQLDGVEVYRPFVLRLARLPRNQLSHAQRRAIATIVRPRAVPLLAGFVFLRGPWWLLTNGGFRGGLVTSGNDSLPIVIPTALVDRVQAYANGGAVHGHITVRRLFGINGELDDKDMAVIERPIASLDAETIVRVLVAQARAAERA